MALPPEQAESELRRLASRWADAVCRKDVEFAVGAWADDGVWTLGPPTDLEAKGKREIAERLRSFWDAIEFSVQVVGAVVVTDVAEDAISGRCLINENLLRTSGESRHMLGYYEDHAVRRDGEWAYAHRRFHFVAVDDTQRNWQSFLGV